MQIALVRRDQARGRSWAHWDGRRPCRHVAAAVLRLAPAFHSPQPLLWPPDACVCSLHIVRIANQNRPCSCSGAGRGLPAARGVRKVRVEQAHFSYDALPDLRQARLRDRLLRRVEGLRGGAGGRKRRRRQRVSAREQGAQRGRQSSVCAPPARACMHVGSSEGSCSEASQGWASAWSTVSRLAAGREKGGGEWRADGWLPVGGAGCAQHRSFPACKPGQPSPRTRVKRQQAVEQVDGGGRGGGEVLLHVCSR